MASQLLVVPLFVTPLERVKVLMQTDASIRSQRACVRALVHEFGVRSVFKGTMLTYAKDVPSFGTYFLVYETLR